MVWKKINLDEQAISEILVEDSDSESGSEASNLEVSLRRRKKRGTNNNNSKPQQKLEHRLQRVADYQPGDRLKEGTQIFIPLSVQRSKFIIKIGEFFFPD
jgi:hypothetical protein